MSSFGDSLHLLGDDHSQVVVCVPVPVLPDIHDGAVRGHILVDDLLPDNPFRAVACFLYDRKQTLTSVEKGRLTSGSSS